MTNYKQANQDLKQRKKQAITLLNQAKALDCLDFKQVKEISEVVKDLSRQVKQLNKVC